MRKILTKFDDLASFCEYLATIRRCDSALHRFTAPLENVVETKATRSCRRRKGERRKLDKKRERKTGKESEWDRTARSRGGGWTFYARRAKDAFESLIPFETLILGAKWREWGVFFGWMTYWASFVCHCVHGRLIQSPMIAYARYTYYVLFFFFFPHRASSDKKCTSLHVPFSFSRFISHSSFFFDNVFSRQRILFVP